MDNTTPPGEQVIQAEPPPLMVTQQQAYTSHSNHGSVGPVIGVLAVIAVLGIIAGMIGRICSGRSIMGYGGRFDMEEWVETKCSSCIDGHVGPSPPRFRPEMVVPPLDHGGGGSRVPVVGFPRMVNRGEIKTEDEEQGRQRESSYEEQQQEEEQQKQEEQNHGYYGNHQQEQQEQQQKQQEQHGYHGNHQQRHSHVEES